jgi:putative transposase
VQRLMRKMGIAALGPKPRTTKPAPGQRSIRICCATSRSSASITSGRPTSPTSRRHAERDIHRVRQPPGGLSGRPRLAVPMLQASH